MGTSDANTDTTQSQQQIVLPPGVTIQPGRQTTQPNLSGNVIQGTQYTIILANGTSSTVFVPDSALGDLAAVQKIFTDKIDALNVIPVG